MKRSKTVMPSEKSRAMRPALTPAAREGQMISLAMDLVEQRLRDGTASSQETTHFLKLATEKAKLECKIMEEQSKLLIAKTESYQTQANIEELYTNAIRAMSRYSGHEDDEEYVVID